ncbi:MAG: hypothetical protein QW812_03285 [Thermoplasmataceae archaeon]
MEGPGARIIAQRLMPIEGKVAILLLGKNSLNRRITDIKVQGKRIYIGIEDGYLMIFFGMAGTLLRRQDKRYEASLAIICEGEIYCFVRCSVKAITESDFKRIYDQRIDIISDGFEPEFVFNMIQKLDGKMKVCDLLLDQSVFSGSGNIIKNEVLFRTRIRPDRNLMDLSPEDVHNLIQNARIFSLMFLDALKAKIPVSKITQIYRKSKCKVCGSTVSTGMMGDNPRLTFYCGVCQL